MGILGLDTQVYDLSAATDFVLEISCANEKQNAPLFVSGLPPAKSFVVMVDVRGDKQACIMVRRVSETHVQCDLMQSLEVVEAEKETAEHIKRSKTLRAELTTMMKCAPEEVYDMLGVTADDTLEGIDKRYITGEGITPETDNRVALIEIGAPIKDDQTWLPALLHICSAACEFMAMPIATKEPAQLPRAARRRLERTGRGVSLVTVGITRAVAVGCKRLPSGDHGRALHFVSGHWRLSEASLHRKWVFDGWRIWIEGHWRGDPAYGVLLHRYVARAA
jgi:hypothetical protein